MPDCIELLELFFVVALALEASLNLVLNPMLHLIDRYHPHYLVVIGDQNRVVVGFAGVQPDWLTINMLIKLLLGIRVLCHPQIPHKQAESALAADAADKLRVLHPVVSVNHLGMTKDPAVVEGLVFAWCHKCLPENLLCLLLCFVLHLLSEIQQDFVVIVALLFNKETVEFQFLDLCQVVLILDLANTKCLPELFELMVVDFNYAGEVDAQEGLVLVDAFVCYLT